jgi:hypothetical protein
MAWVKIDHKFHWDRLIEPLSDAAYRLYVGGLCYCNWQETDGHIPAGQLRRLIGNGMSSGRLSRAIGELETAGLWAPRLVDGGYEIKNYLKFQPSKAQLEEQRVSMRELGKRGGVASGLKRSGSSDTLNRVAEATSLNPVTSRTVTSRHVTSGIGFKNPNETGYPRADGYVFGRDGTPRGEGEPE